MKLKDFRKLLLGCNPEAEVVFTLTSGVRVQKAEIVGVSEHNLTADGRHAEPVVDVQVRINVPAMKDKDFNWETGQKKEVKKSGQTQLDFQS